MIYLLYQLIDTIQSSEEFGAGKSRVSSHGVQSQPDFEAIPLWQCTNCHCLLHFATDKYVAETNYAPFCNERKIGKNNESHNKA